MTLRPTASAATAIEASADVAVDVRRVAKCFAETTVLAETNLRVARGQTMVLLGASGCGKTTLLRLIAGFEAPTYGEIWLRGKNATLQSPAQRGIAMVFQSYALYPHMTVAENIQFGLRANGIDKSQADIAERYALESLSMTTLANRRPAELSGGQKQRVAIARLLAKARVGIADTFLLDEPLSNLDAQLRERLRTELRGLFAELGRTTVYVTHDQTEAMTIGDQIAILRAGKIEQVGTPSEVFDAPQTLYVAEFLGQPRINVLPASKFAALGERASEYVQHFPDNTTFAIRPQHFSTTPSSDSMAIDLLLPRTHILGSQLEVRGLVAGQEVVASLPRDGQWSAAEKASKLYVRTDEVLAFDAQTGTRIPSARLSARAAAGVGRDSR